LPWAARHHKDQKHDRLHAQMLCEFFEGRTLRQITRLAVEGFKLKRAATDTKFETPRSPRTVNAELTTLSRILGLAVEHKMLRENPCGSVRRLEAEDGPIRRLSAEEEEALLSSAGDGPAFLAPMIRLALWTGLRQGELIALTRAAVDFGRNRLFVVNPKWRRDERRTFGVPMGREVRQLLEQLCRDAEGEYLFGGQRLKRLTVDHYFRKACARAGIVGFRFHDLRHEYGSRLGDADVNLKKIARLMGHSRTRQTERYVHPTDDGLLAATEVAARGQRSRIVPKGLRKVG
jgi:integrase